MKELLINYLNKCDDEELLMAIETPYNSGQFPKLEMIINLNEDLFEEVE